jgi:uncharacterized protein
MGVEVLEDAPAGARLEVTLSREAGAQVVLVRGSLHADFALACARCLRPATVRVDETELRVSFLPQERPVGLDDAQQGEDGDEEELSGEAGFEDEGTFSHDGEVIDLEPMLRELLLLAIPMAPLCAPECRGLCPSCGADLNRESCGCPQPGAAATPWRTALEGLKKSV